MYNQHIVLHLVWLRVHRDTFSAAIYELLDCYRDLGYSESLIAALDSAIDAREMIDNTIFPCKLALTLDSMS